MRNHCSEGKSKEFIKSYLGKSKEFIKSYLGKSKEFIKSYYCSIVFVLVVIIIMFFGHRAYVTMQMKYKERVCSEKRENARYDAIKNQMEKHSDKLGLLYESINQVNDSLVQIELSNISRQIRRLQYCLKNDTISVNVKNNK